MDSIKNRITRAGGRLTGSRQQILSILLEAEHTLTHAELLDAARNQGLILDRVTVYRVLEWLISKDLAHKVAGPDRVWRFKAVTDEVHPHAHFHCSDCGLVYCLEEVVPSFALVLPPGFRYERAECSIEGTCPHCTE